MLWIQAGSLRLWPAKGPRTKQAQGHQSPAPGPQVISSNSVQFRSPK